MFSRILFLAVCAVCLSVCCDGSALKPFNFMNNYEWSSSQGTETSSGTSYSETRRMTDNEQGSKEVITKTVVKTGSDGKAIANTTIIIIQRDFDGKIIDKKVQNKVGPANQEQQKAVSSGNVDQTESNMNIKVDDGCMDDFQCPADKFCSSKMKCEDQRPEGEDCFRNRECANGGRCIMQRCRAVRKDGKTGSFCERDGECAAGHCCVAFEDAGRCAYLTREGEECGPDGFFGGMSWFTSRLPERCPCETGLSCDQANDAWSFGKTCLAKTQKKSKAASHKKRKH